MADRKRWFKIISLLLVALNLLPIIIFGGYLVSYLLNPYSIEFYPRPNSVLRSSYIYGLKWLLSLVPPILLRIFYPAVLGLLWSPVILFIGGVVSSLLGKSRILLFSHIVIAMLHAIIGFLLLL